MNNQSHKKKETGNKPNNNAWEMFVDMEKAFKNQHKVKTVMGLKNMKDRAKKTLETLKMIKRGWADSWPEHV